MLLCDFRSLSIYSFFQHLTQYSVIHSLAAVTLFLNYLKYFFSLPMKFQPETIWFPTQTKNEIQGSGWIRYEWNKYTKTCLTEILTQMCTCSSKAMSCTHDFPTCVAGEQALLPVRKNI